MVELQFLNLWLLKTVLKGNDESSCTLFPTSGQVYVWTSPKVAYNPECLAPPVKHGARSVMIWSAVFSILLVLYLLWMVELMPLTTWTFYIAWCILWSRCCFLTMMQFFKMMIRTYIQPEVFTLGLTSTSAASLVSSIVQLKNHGTTVVSFREQGEKQIPSTISQATRRRVVQNSTRDCSEVTWVYSKKDTSCVAGKWWPESILIKKCVSFTAVFIIFVHPLYMLPSYIPLGD